MKLLFFCMAISLPYALAGQDSSVMISSSTSVNDLVFTEILADPDPVNGLPDGEFAEVFNRSSQPVNLSGWTFYDGSSRVLPAVTIQPQQFLIICANSDTAAFNLFGKCAGISSISLTNTGEKISLRNPQGIPIDSVVYSDSWYGTSFKKDGGWSLERVDVDFTCSIASNWRPSENIAGGTPGTVNSVAGVFVDDTPPKLLRAFCPDSLHAVLVFDESLQALNALSINSYSISLPVSNIVFDDIEMKKVRLSFTNPVQHGTIYQVSVTGVADCAGNTVATENTAQFGIGDTILQGNLTFNEVLFNPFEGGEDFVELYNLGNTIIDLSQIKIVSIDDETGNIDEETSISDDPYLIFPEQYVVITPKESAVAQVYKSSSPFGFVELPDLPSMNIDRGHIALEYVGQRIDEFRYEDSYHFSLLNDVKGISLEKIEPYRNSMSADNWHSASQSAGFATPGLKNSQYSNNPSTDEPVKVYPEIFSPDGDGRDDVMSIAVKSDAPGYISNIKIFDSSGNVIKDLQKNRLLGMNDDFSWDGISDNGERASIGIYVAWVEVFNLSGTTHTYRLPFVIAEYLK